MGPSPPSSLLKGCLEPRFVPDQNSTTRNGDESQVNFPLIMIAGKAGSERHATAYPQMQTPRLSVPLVRETVGNLQAWTDTLWYANKGKVTSQTAMRTARVTGSQE
ncbi:hypothetical protein Purlil1_11513 [Purpureocillium lilacinum]|uniref:Uncharacterized protein n=1 Tax=Purpureocillium lilacinum TaxID=33203 RepID=A0ABR0BJJ9_PURLI|nr:hypothetical protein Purlil1_11513 [Purpureocillium lilacinum]